MKFCLSSRQEDSYLRKADEIKFFYRDRKAIPDFIEKYPMAVLILVHSSLDDEINWNEIKDYSVLARGNFIFCVDTVQDCIAAEELEIKHYHNAAVKTPYELNALKNLNVCYALVDAPLFFDTEYLKEAGVPIRAIPNMSQKDGLPRENGIVGSWIRPEDLHFYNDVIAAVEFEDLTEDREKYYRKERAMYRIYAEQKHWPGDLGMLVGDLHFSALNRVIHPDVTRARLHCKQKCENGGHCRLCYRALTMANQQEILEYREKMKED